MNGHCMADVSCWWTCNHLIGRAPQRYFELANTVDTVENSKEVDSNIWSTKSLVEILHELLQFSVLVGLRNVATRLLVAAESVPSELDHFLVTLGQEAKTMDHLSKKSCRVGATRESKNVDMIAWLIVTHDEAVACEKVLLE